jgi:hypothetical protein
MDWIKVLEASPLSVALLVCVILALGLFWLIKHKKNGNGSPSELATVLARFETHMNWAKAEIESMKSKVDPLVIAVATLNVIVGALKERVEENHEQLDKKLDRVLDRLGE